MMTTAIYTQVSKSDGPQDPENQRELQIFCKRRGWEIAEAYTDFASVRSARWQA
jgi:DNA invertase Pin-like site-specific DNA recombinase